MLAARHIARGSQSANGLKPRKTAGDCNRERLPRIETAD
jgi:hypothetical protein